MFQPHSLEHDLEFRDLVLSSKSTECAAFVTFLVLIIKHPKKQPEGRRVYLGYPLSSRGTAHCRVEAMMAGVIDVVSTVWKQLPFSFFFSPGS